MLWRFWVVFLLIWVINAQRLNRAQKPATMRRIDLIVIHCTGTRASADQRRGAGEVSSFLRVYECGYHFYIRRDGNMVSMRPIEKAGAHAKGYNSHSIGIAYEGGVDSFGNPKDTRTLNQRFSLQSLVAALLSSFLEAKVTGHRDLSPDLNGNGKIESHEWVKSCPYFDVETDL